VLRDWRSCRIVEAGYRLITILKMDHLHTRSWRSSANDALAR
jgi:hypothetical protein